MKKFIAAIALAAIASSAFAQNTVSIEEGAIVLNGSYTQLAGIEAKSDAGGLSIAQVELAPGVVLDDKSPFSIADGNIVQNTPNAVVLGVLGADKRIDVEGPARTGILYSGGPADLSVAVGLGDAAPAAIPVVPEPATGLMAAFGLVGLLGLRRRR